MKTTPEINTGHFFRTGSISVADQPQMNPAKYLGEPLLRPSRTQGGVGQMLFVGIGASLG
ncbi:hypothetical protein AC578_1548 [Pseudocercospora eumusae]|uniref:Uncharacterized protein n=1 Tax=Pseudocercospora eumusae TaxID=321146 RepID=A0A139HLV1_9PEZI|nr:hypothetical protein AC578_1548 [Pseudocercospora eumusae]